MTAVKKRCVMGLGEIPEGGKALISKGDVE